MRSITRVTAAALLQAGSLVLLAACGDSSVTNPLAPRGPTSPADTRTSQLTLDVEAANITLGGDAVLQARTFRAGGPLQPASGVVWTSSDDQVVRITDGRVAGLRVGSATVWARLGVDSVSALVAVEPAASLDQIAGSSTAGAAAAPDMDGALFSGAPMRWLAISSGVTAMVAGQSRQFEARAWDASYREVASAAVVWESSAPGVLAVDASGDVTALGEGSAVITARVAGDAAPRSSVVVVSMAPPTSEVLATSVVVSPTFVSVAPNRNTKLTATARGASGETLNGRDINWTTSNALVATVSDAGIVRSVAGGTAIITAEADGKTAPAMVRVSGPALAGVARIALSPTVAQVTVGASVQLTADPRSSTDEPLSGRTVSFTSSSPAVATVSAAGLVTAVATGNTTITAVSENASSSAAITVLDAPAVTPPPVAPPTAVAISIVLVEFNAASLAVGQSTQAVAHLKDAAGNVVTARSVAWTSSAPRVARVSPEGLVTADSAGSAVITAAVDGRTGAATMSVAASGATPPAVAPPVVVASVQVVLNASALTVGENTQAVATARSAAGDTLARVSTWTSSAPAIATVSSTGVVTAVSAGSTTISASTDGKSGSALVSVTSPVVLPPPPTGSIATPAELPRVYIDTRYEAPTGRTIAVGAGANLQTVLDTAKYGDLILLQPGATFVGNFRLTPKSGTGRITIRTNTMLPAEGERMTPAKAVNLAKVMSANSMPALYTEGAANGYRIIGVEFGMTASSTYGYNIVGLGEGTETTEAQLPRDLVLDRVYIHGHATSDISRCVAMNSGSAAVIDSYLSECHGKGRDAQAICGWNGTGPFKIVNNFLEGSGENVMFGGGMPRIANLVPSDIEVRGNHFFKPMAWMASGTWLVKNIFELKAGRRVLVEGNVMENNWSHGQNGTAIVLYTNNEGGQTWNIVSDVTFRNNIVRNVAGAVGVSAGFPGAQPARRMTFTNNLFDRVGDTRLGLNGRMFQLFNNADDVLVSHNTFVFAPDPVGKQASVMLEGDKPSRFEFVNNVTEGMVAATGMNGTTGLSAAVNGYKMEGNVLSGVSAYYAAYHPAGNFYVAGVADVGFQNWLAGDVRLGALSTYRGKGTDGRDPGVDYAALVAKTSGVVQP